LLLIWIESIKKGESITCQFDDKKLANVQEFTRKTNKSIFRMKIFSKIAKHKFFYSKTPKWYSLFISHFKKSPWTNCQIIWLLAPDENDFITWENSIRIKKSPVTHTTAIKRSVNFEMSFWHLQIDQKNQRNFCKDFCPSL
jgi:hypothetical protein